jgi:hypothetical protein
LFTPLSLHGVVDPVVAAVSRPLSFSLSHSIEPTTIFVGVQNSNSTTSRSRIPQIEFRGKARLNARCKWGEFLKVLTGTGSENNHAFSGFQDGGTMEAHELEEKKQPPSSSLLSA